MRHTLLPILCTLALAACSTSAPQGSTKIDVTAKPQNGFEITGKAVELPEKGIMPNDHRVSVYSTEGPLINPLTQDRTHSVLDNTTAGGYTVFDESVKVFPLPGDDVPSYIPSYAVPPLEGQYAAKQPGAIGEPMGLASAGILPPVPNVEVKTVPRKPMSLTAPEPLTMQPPSNVRTPMTSPFDDAGNVNAGVAKPRAPSMLTGVEDPAVSGPSAPPVMPPAPDMPPADVAKPGTAKGLTPGRRSTPLLTGY